MSSSHSYTLYYFNARGRAEPIRLIFSQAGQKFEDRRISFENWPDMKSQMPLGQMPVLEIDGKKYPQSLAFSRYLARQFNLTGKDDLEAAKCDIIVDTIQEISEAYYTAKFFIKDEKLKAEAEEKFANETLPTKLAGLQKLINDYGDGTWTVGSQVSWADFWLYNALQNFLTVDSEILKKYTTLNNNCSAVEKLPNIAAYLANREQTPF